MKYALLYLRKKINLIFNNIKEKISEINKKKFIILNFIKKGSIKTIYNSINIFFLSYIYLYALVFTKQIFLRKIFLLPYTPYYSIWAKIIRCLSCKFIRKNFKLIRLHFIIHLLIHLVARNNVFRLSKIIQYNVVLVIILLNLQSLILTFWETFMHWDSHIKKSSAKLTADWILKDTEKFTRHRIVETDVSFYINAFIYSTFIYLMFYIIAITGHYPFSVPGFEWITDSVALWVQLSTPALKKKIKDTAAPSSK